MNLSIVIPCFNEENFILEKLLNVKKNISEKDEVIIVNDASTDYSKNKIEKFIENEKNFYLINHEKNYGKGACLISAFKKVNNDIIIIQDADLEYNPNEYKKLINPINNNSADVVFGSRFIGSDAHRVFYFYNRIANMILTFLTNIICNINLTDMETGFKAFKKSSLNQINLNQKGFGIEPELTIKFAKKKLKIFEVGISYSGRSYEEGKKIGMLDFFIAIYCIIKYRVTD